MSSNKNRHRLKNIWAWIKQRCNNPNSKIYKYYWGRGIQYDKAWESYKWFLNNIPSWYNDSLQLDRIDNNKWYSKDNCRWVTRAENSRNRRSNIYYKWECLKDYCIKNKLNYKNISSRIIKWMDIETAINKPTRPALQPICAYYHGKFHSRYDSISDASFDLKIDRTTISHILAGRQKQSKFYTFFYELNQPK